MIKAKQVQDPVHKQVLQMMLHRFALFLRLGLHDRPADGEIAQRLSLIHI